MEERFLGEIIREKRLEQGLSLEELSEGICDVSTLSRLETGKQSPTRHKLNRLLQKLGISDDRFELIIPSVSHKTLILYSLARELLIVEDNKRAQEYAEEGRKLAIKYSAYLKLPGYLMILAECEHRNGNDDKCKELLKETYYLCKIIGDDANEKIIEDGFMEYYGVKI